MQKERLDSHCEPSQFLELKAINKVTEGPTNKWKLPIDEKPISRISIAAGPICRESVTNAINVRPFNPN